MQHARSDRTDLICVAVVVGAHGVRGGLKLRCFTEDPADAGAYGPLLDEAGQRLFEIRVTGTVKDGVIARAEGIDDRDAAQKLRGQRLFVPRARLPEPEADAFYRADVIDLEVTDEAGRRLGRVTGLEDFGAGDVLVFAGTDGGETMVPFTRAHIPVVDLEGGRIVVADLFDAESGEALIGPGHRP